ncbi:Retrovirus-related Pol polyprotein from transposon TNT 1-94 [Cucumis melo var. makuwa]|uniref:Retrovirus-related Pol polyprotein from transposon TNT 1-94 n=1 Tax=Cucumis melo var. makuwa TaxID=1194695 RepID=A0A5A7SY86_CUCMM|nr:Retrovirus-related Pol polyprotein from transposon TNT 1-94 [Cucumis melo var. makuwa]TYK19727.1 Retrovirus-related Pol polyprotein from transposon TNT 1-94 [Cucumis melo var. makuwa]
MDLDLALRTDKPAATKEQSNTANIEKCKRSSHMYLMIIKHSIPESVQGEASNLLTTLTSMRYKDNGNIRGIKRERTENAHLATNFHGKKKRKPTDAVKGTSQQNKKQAMENPCFFCKKKNHLKKDCPKYAKWHVKKGYVDVFHGVEKIVGRTESGEAFSTPYQHGVRRGIPDGPYANATYGVDNASFDVCCASGHPSPTYLMRPSPDVS